MGRIETDRYPDTGHFSPPLKGDTPPERESQDQDRQGTTGDCTENDLMTAKQAAIDAHEKAHALQRKMLSITLGPLRILKERAWQATPNPWSQL